VGLIQATEKILEPEITTPTQEEIIEAAMLVVVTEQVAAVITGRVEITGITTIEILKRDFSTGI
jgi:hypothetical protein